MQQRLLPLGFHRVTVIAATVLTAWFLQSTPQAFAESTAQSPANGTHESDRPVVDEATEQAVQQAQDAGNAVVVLQTNVGALHLALFPEQAPKSVENFLTYVKDGFYDGTVFHRVIEGFMIQGGGLDIRLEAKDTREPVINEADNGLLNEPFTLAMARTGDPHSATSQFFINTANNEFLNHKGKSPTGWGYTVFGKLIGGQRIAEWMSKAPTGSAGRFAADVPLAPLIINKAQLIQQTDTN